jgi:hypothetical protein
MLTKKIIVDDAKYQYSGYTDNMKQIKINVLLDENLPSI